MTLGRGIIAELTEIVGPAQLLDSPELTEKYRIDWTGRFRADDAIVARPSTVDEIAAIIKICGDRGIAIVPQGGNTGLVGGSVPLDGELVVSTERLIGVESVHATTGLLVAAAGTPLAHVQRAAHKAGWGYGVDIASRDTATIGGTVATNAAGLRVLRYGATRAQVTSIAFVDGTGTTHALSAGTLRDNTGFHMPSVMCGSEGTLGLITQVRVSLVPDYPERTTALVRFDDPRDAACAVESVRGFLPSVESAELFFASGVELVCMAFGLALPFAENTGGYVLVEIADTSDQTEQLGDVVASWRGVADVAVAHDSSGRKRLWQYRERHTEAIATIGTPHKLDVAVPPGMLADFIDAVPDVVAHVDPVATVWLFGHGGEAAVHVNVTGLAANDDTVDNAVLQLVADFGGSISAEHGIGTAKLGWIGLAHDPESLALRCRLKAAFDPHNIMNPNVLTAG